MPHLFITTGIEYMTNCSTGNKKQWLPDQAADLVMEKQIPICLVGYNEGRQPNSRIRSPV